MSELGGDFKILVAEDIGNKGGETTSIKVKSSLIFWENVLNYARMANRLSDSYSFKERFNVKVKNKRKLLNEFKNNVQLDIYVLPRIYNFIKSNKFSLLVHASSFKIVHNLLFHLMIRDKVFFAQMDRLKIDKLVFCYQGPHAETHLLIRYCKKREIKLIFFQHNWDNLSSKEILHLFPDKLLVWSFQCCLHATSIMKMNPESVVIAGNPRLDEHVNNRNALVKYAVPKNSRKIMFFGDSSDLDEVFVLGHLSKVMDSLGSGWHCEYRPHPYLTKKRFNRNNCPKNIQLDVQFEEEYFSEHSMFNMENFLIRLSSLKSDEFVRKILDAEIIIASGSTICLEAALLRKPVVFVNARFENGHVLDKTHFFGFSNLRGIQVINEEEINEVSLKKIIETTIAVSPGLQEVKYFYHNVDNPDFRHILTQTIFSLN
jgi:hypothetical protein